MKKLLIGLLVLGSVSSFADCFYTKNYWSIKEEHTVLKKLKPILKKKGYFKVDRFLSTGKNNFQLSISIDQLRDKEYDFELNLMNLEYYVVNFFGTEFLQAQPRDFYSQRGHKTSDIKLKTLLTHLLSDLPHCRDLNN